MIVDASDWPQPERDRAVDWVFDHPHPNTVEDVEFLKVNFGTDQDGCRDLFKKAPVFGVFSQDGLPVYIFAVNEVEGRRVISTASEARLESFRWQMTKALIRFRRSDLSRRMLAGSIIFADQADIRDGKIRYQWARAVGFEPYANWDISGISFVCFHFKGD